MKKYDAEYFLRKFDSIPEDRWAEGKYSGRDGKRCVLGHCGQEYSFIFLKEIPEEAHKLFLLLTTRLNVSPWEINDNMFDRYSDLGDTPKERIMNVLILINAGVTL